MEAQTQPPTQTNTQGNSSKTLAVGAAIAVVAVGAIGYKLLSEKNETSEESSDKNRASTEPVVSTAPVNYKDGEYNVVGNYTSPAGPEEIGVKVTLTNNIVSDVAVTPKATHPFSVKWQKTFSENYKSMVVGKDINSLKILEAVAGSSLTPKGFNDAIEKIKASANN